MTHTSSYLTLSFGWFVVNKHIRPHIWHYPLVDYLTNKAAVRLGEIHKQVSLYFGAVYQIICPRPKLQSTTTSLVTVTGKKFLCILTGRRWKANQMSFRWLEGEPGLEGSPIMSTQDWLKMKPSRDHVQQTYYEYVHKSVNIAPQTEHSFGQ